MVPALPALPPSLTVAQKAERKIENLIFSSVNFVSSEVQKKELILGTNSSNWVALFSGGAFCQ